MKRTIPGTSFGAYSAPLAVAVPSVLSVIGSALRDGWSLLKRNAAGAILLAIIGMGLDIVTTQTPLHSGINLASIVAQTILAFVFTYFGATAATRTINPAYGMSAGGFVRFVALLVAVVLLTVVGLAAANCARCLAPRQGVARALRIASRLGETVQRLLAGNNRRILENARHPFARFCLGLRRRAS